MIFAPGLLALASASWSIVLGGDIMLNGVSPAKSPFAKIQSVFHNADAAFANLEVPMTSIGSRTVRKTSAELKARTQFVLRADPRQLRWLKPAGITAVSLGNNHAMDYGPLALKQELAGLDELGIKHTGAGANKLAASSVTVVTLASGFKIGLISGLAFIGAGALGKCTPATDSAAGVNALSLGGRADAPWIAQWVKAAHRKCDFLVVALHGGIERHPFPTAYQVQLAHAFIDAGADVVWGHHPHVLEGAELYHGHPILYSMGNLVSPTPAASGLIRLTFTGSDFGSAEFIPTQVRSGRVLPLKPREYAAREGAFLRLCDQTAIKVHGVALPLSAK